MNIIVHDISSAYIFSTQITSSSSSLVMVLFLTGHPLWGLTKCFKQWPWFFLTSIYKEGVVMQAFCSLPNRSVYDVWGPMLIVPKKVTMHSVTSRIYHVLLLIHFFNLLFVSEWSLRWSIFISSFLSPPMLACEIQMPLFRVSNRSVLWGVGAQKHPR